MNLQKSRNTHQTRSIPFSNTEQLFEDIQNLYPAVTSVMIVDLDDRDEEYLPKISHRNFNRLQMTTTYTAYQWKKTPRANFSGTFRYLIVVVEKGTATIKQGRAKMEFQN